VSTAGNSADSGHILLATRTQVNGSRRTIKIAIAITAPRLKARNGETAEAGQGLGSQLGESTKANLLGSEFEIRLAAAEIKATSDAQSAGVSLKVLDHDAKASGYLLFAARAENLGTSRH